MQTVIDMKDHGKMVNAQIMAFTNMPMETFMMDNGETISNKDMESLKWQQEINTKANGKEERKMEQVFFE
jgi:hypothetical protein